MDNAFKDGNKGPIIPDELIEGAKMPKSRSEKALYEGAALLPECDHDGRSSAYEMNWKEGDKVNENAWPEKSSGKLDDSIKGLKDEANAKV